MDVKKLIIGAVIGSLLIGLIKSIGKKKAITKDEYNRLKDINGIGSPINGRLILTSPFGNRKNPITGAGQFHNGVDLISAEGKTDGRTVTASLPGEVIKNYYDAAGGYQLIINSGFAVFGYAHLKSKSPLNIGDIVKKGDLIGYVGNTGASTGPHLHFTLRLGGVLVNPINEIPALKNAIV
jgi:murein DD-endopeptidase MepM/ murein hydrolase activator NlpD